MRQSDPWKDCLPCAIEYHEFLDSVWQFLHNPADKQQIHLAVHVVLYLYECCSAVRPIT